ncbi:ferritin-like metal-binding protein YciE [Filimonas zeae]|uniref:YciE/YciF family protein n=1 Tax=Filimonas zeae TaxID=1737353 RepID=A0A917J1J7_9BACT|nr:ferritin-like domain-containing protein [Filimonas zeae]MDR6339814.1 ferritin-like metal-binding protein YciE [Filimonas zeae]GGH69783.1 YciE/YciF family protein [Filimonas zeae]
METLEETQTNVHSRLEQFFNTMLQEIYWSELQLVNVLGTMRDRATTRKLQNAFEQHLSQTQTHVRRLEEVFQLLNQEASPEPCAGLQGLFDEGWQVIDETEDGTAQRDAALIIAAQKVEHYEMACYGSLATLGRTIGQERIAHIFEETLAEEKETDALLTQIAEGSINYQASRELADDIS